MILLKIPVSVRSSVPEMRLFLSVFVCKTIEINCFLYHMQKGCWSEPEGRETLMKRLVYLDNAATTQPFPEVLDAMILITARY